MEDYKGKYENLMERLRKAKVDNNVYDERYSCVIDDIVPELKESEDERMIQYFKDLAPFDKADELYEKYCFSHKDAIAWLEKKGEQNKVEPKFKVKYAGGIYNLLEVQHASDVTYYGIEYKPNHIYYVLSDKCEII